jgi:hypothetical protein
MRLLSSPTIPAVPALPASGAAGSLLYFGTSFYGWDGSTWHALDNRATTISDVDGLSTVLASKQPSSSTLTAFAGVGSGFGVLELTGTDSFSVRSIGRTNDTDLLTKNDGEILFANATHSHPISDISGLSAALDGKVDDGAVTTSGLTMATNTILGRSTALTGAIQELTGDSVTEMLRLFGQNEKGLVPAPGGIANKFLRDDGTWDVPTDAAATWGQISGTLSSQTDLANSLALAGSQDSGLQRNGAFDQWATASLPLGWSGPCTRSTTSSVRGSYTATIGGEAVLTTTEHDRIPVVGGENLYLSYRYGTTADRTNASSPFWNVSVVFRDSAGVNAGEVFLEQAQPLAAGLFQTQSKTVAVPAQAKVAYLRIGFDDGYSGSGAIGLVDYFVVDRFLSRISTPGVKGEITVSDDGTSWAVNANSITNAKLMTMPSQTIKGNRLLSSGVADDLTGTHVTAMLDTFTAADKGLVPPPGALNGYFLKDDGSWGPLALDPTLAALADLDAQSGLVEQTGADTFTKRYVGVANSTDIITRGNADTRYAANAHTHSFMAVSNADNNFSTDQSFQSNVTIQGSLFVQGSTVTVDTTNLDVADAIITLAKDNTGTESYIGLKAERGAATDAFLVWDETFSRWTAYQSNDDLGTRSYSRIAASRFISTVATADGAPFDVLSTVMVNNLNADLLDGKEASEFSLTGHGHTGFSQGVAGFVPGPSAGEVSGGRFLRADGLWANAASSFSSLTDTIAYAAGDANKLVRVNATGSGIEYGANTVNLALLNTAQTWSATQTFANATFTGVSIMGNAAVTTDDKRLVLKNEIVVSKDPGVGQFSGIKAALDSITDASSTKRYVVKIGPGVYLEAPFAAKPYVYLVGQGYQNTIVQATTTSQPLYTGCDNSAVYGLTFAGAATAGGIGVYYPSYPSGLGGGTGTFNLTQCAFQSNHIGIKIDSSTTNCTAILNSCIVVCSSGIAAGAIGVEVTASGGSVADVSITAMEIRNLGSTTTYAFSTSGAGAKTLAATLSVRSAQNVGTGISVRDGAAFNGAGGIVTGYAQDIHVPDGGVAPAIGITSFELQSAAQLNIAHAGTTGHFSGTAQRGKVVVHVDCTATIFYSDPVSTGVTSVGPLFIGPAHSQTIDFNPIVTNGTNLGLLSGGAITDGGALVLNVASGVGYAADTGSPVARVEWNATTLNLGANSNSFIYVTSAGIVSQSATTPSNAGSFILLGRVATDSDSIDFIETNSISMVHLARYQERALRLGLGPIYTTGSIVSEGTLARSLNITSGTYFYGSTRIQPVGGTGVAFKWYRHVSGQWFDDDETPPTQITNAFYDNGTDLVALGAGKYTKHALYVVLDAGVDRYMLVTGQQEFDTLVEVEAGPLPTPPNSFNGSVALIAGMIVQQGLANIVSIFDARPIVGHKASALSAATSHGNLLGLGDDDHPQYLLATGSRSLAGDLNLGGHKIANAANVTSTRFSSTEMSLSPLVVRSNVVVTNLNADLLDGLHSTAFANSSHNHSVFTTSTSGFVPAPTTTTGKFLKDDGTWSEVVSQMNDSFTGDGTTTAFVMSSTVAAPGDLVVTVDGLMLLPDSHYGVSGTTLTLASAPANGTTIQARRLGGAKGTSSAGTSWAPVTAVGTGESQDITLPESVTVNDVLVFVEGVFQHGGFTISGTTLTTTQPSGYGILIVRYGRGSSGAAASTYAATIGDGSTATFTLTHNFNSRDITVEVYEAGSPYRTILAEVARPTLNTISVTFDVTKIPTTNQYRVVVKS